MSSADLTDNWNTEIDSIGSPIDPDTGLPISREKVEENPEWAKSLLSQNNNNDKTWGWTEENNKMTPKEKQDLINTCQNWWHSVFVGDNICTQGRVKRLYMGDWGITPEILKGKSFLDIGIRDGGYSFYAERMGASKVMGVDIDKPKGFDILKEIFDSKVEYLEKDVIDLKPEDVGGTYDVVLFAGVFYHMKFPFLSLHKVAELMDVGGILILESFIDMNLERPDLRNTPLMQFYPSNELQRDETNWHGPNLACLIAMLEAIGFKVTKNKKLHGDRAVLHATKVNNDVIKNLNTNNIPKE